MGGDEFVVLLPETGDKAGIEAVSERILQALARPLLLQGTEVTPGASIGVVLFPDHGTNWLSAYKAADVAWYQAKHDGRGIWRWYGEMGTGVRT
jgi:diguanylate cyclase (GGDEF)-like protein